MSDRLQLHLERMLECAELAAGYASDMTRDTFLANRKTQQAIVLNSMVIGETANRILEDDDSAGHRLVAATGALQVAAQPFFLAVS